jgi:hypothetical protein
MKNSIHISSQTSSIFSIAFYMINKEKNEFNSHNIYYYPSSHIHINKKEFLLPCLLCEDYVITQIEIILLYFEKLYIVPKLLPQEIKNLWKERLLIKELIKILSEENYIDLLSLFVEKENISNKYFYLSTVLILSGIISYKNLYNLSHSNLIIFDQAYLNKNSVISTSKYFLKDIH